VRSFIAMWALGQARLAALVRHAAHGSRQRPRFMTPSRCC
jgi:hypothetical protein